MRAVPVGDNKALVCRYLSERIGLTIEPDNCNGYAILSDEGAFCGAMMVANIRYTEGVAIDCEAMCASDSPHAWSDNVFTTFFNYVFKQLGCVRCTAIVGKNNTKIRTFLEALNFVLEGNVRKGYDGHKDALIYGLLAEDCRFLEG